MTRLNKIKRNATNVSFLIISALVIAAIMVADKNVGMNLMAAAIGLSVFMTIVSADFRRMF